jgi:hypothetical protein
MPNVASMVTLAVHTNDLRFIPIASFGVSLRCICFVSFHLVLFHALLLMCLLGQLVATALECVNLTPRLSTDDERGYCRQVLISI